ncbi:MAG: 2-oxoglutarate dehydrogenase E1 component [Crocinitomicaceae bacterium]|nr:2-oxoglutarate dehydrogenase E1 component [Crocinitomicaceae bacterium]
MDKFSYVGNGDVNAVNSLYEQYLQDPESVDFGWKKFFEGFEFSKTDFEDAGEIPQNFQKEFKVINLINDYRSRGHLFTKTNPVRTRRKYSPTLDIENFGLDKGDLEVEFNAGAEIGLGKTKLKNIIEHLDQTYCTSIGIEYTYIRQPEVIDWIKSKIEPTKNTPDFNKTEKLEILKKLNQAVGFESFLHKKFVGQKRFSLEGGEALIPALNTVVEHGAENGIQEFVLGMSHRGRLNVLANIFNKSYEAIFTEFEGKEYEDNLFDGDVKYHLGYSCDVTTDRGKKVLMTLAPNPSHLEAVDPVVGGIARAKIDDYLNDETKICPILIHGDASISGQGVVYEVIQMAGLDGYRTGGTIHIVINNQIGFTTNYIDGRSSTYCTDVGKVTLSPVFHVNGDDVEAVVHTIKLALEYRQKYHKDVFIDLLCYRKYGHNEGDEPRFTQPLLYKAIAKHPNPRDIYLETLINEKVVGKDEQSKLEQDFKAMLEDDLSRSRQNDLAVITSFLEEAWTGLKEADLDDFKISPKTGVSKKKFLELGEKITNLPEGKSFLRKVVRLIGARKTMLQEGTSLDWAMGELMAYATLLDEGFSVRVSGQDVERGTFSHRHAVLKVEDSEEEYVSLRSVQKKNSKFDIYNSFLSEYGVLGFEYGYALALPNTLPIWEAQFGDFFNGAQIIVDQFITPGEDKWKVMNGLVMLLPHGYEGQGAEHSSARVERFLQAAAENNIQVTNCTTPANFFHVLRRQLHRPIRKPLIVFTPKSLLRHPKCVSAIEDFTKGGFQEVMDDPYADPKKVEKVMFCTGKIYYDLIEEREKRGVNNIAFIRMEQLYPVPYDHLDVVLEKYKKVKNSYWVQEEPENMGPWSFILRRFPKVNLELISRKSSASPATGSSKRHASRYAQVMDEVFK